MVKSAATSVDAYLAELPPERREVIAKVRDFVRKHLPKGYDETMNWGMICWQIPLSRYPVTYNKQPLGYLALAAQKNNYTLYLSSYQDEELDRTLREAYTKAGKKLDMGLCCLHFKKLEDLLLGPIGDVIASTSVEAYIARYEANRSKTATGKAAAVKAAAKKAPVKKATVKAAKKK